MEERTTKLRPEVSGLTNQSDTVGEREEERESGNRELIARRDLLMEG
jgi:hypothetical protein